MLKRLIKNDNNFEDLTIGKLYDHIDGKFLDDFSDSKVVKDKGVKWESAPNAPLPHADIRKAEADGWPIERRAEGKDWVKKVEASFYADLEYQVADTETPQQKRLKEIEQEINALIAEATELE